MASFTNYATLSYRGTTIRSNTVTGELAQTLAVTKAAIQPSYAPGGRVSYVVSLTNSGSTAQEGLTLTDDLAGYAFETGTLYPLSYAEGTVRYYVNGAAQNAPQVTAGPPLTVTGLRIPAGGSAMLLYETELTENAPPAAGSAITNTVRVTGGTLTAPLTASATVPAAQRAALSITKAICPAVVTENGQLSYTFVIENTGSVADETAVLQDVFDPVLRSPAVRYNGTLWEAGTNYRYDEQTGVFATLPGEILVPAASYTRNPDGSFLTVPGTAVLEVTGTV